MRGQRSLPLSTSVILSTSARKKSTWLFVPGNQIQSVGTPSARKRCAPDTGYSSGPLVGVCISSDLRHQSNFENAYRASRRFEVRENVS